MTERLTPRGNFDLLPPTAYRLSPIAEPCFYGNIPEMR